MASGCHRCLSISSAFCFGPKSEESKALSGLRVNFFSLTYFDCPGVARTFGSSFLLLVNCQILLNMLTLAIELTLQVKSVSRVGFYSSHVKTRGPLCPFVSTLTKDVFIDYTRKVLEFSGIRVITCAQPATN